ncbi:HNH endonuclease [Promineifilum sp.]|uniref:HNH endonuclease n=1 Tax=Promineifilum sp. TaxID=2664178 RepID=UPI0035B09138
MTYVPATLRRQVIARAGDRCEYCRHPQIAALFPFEMEHVISEKHGGVTNLDNLALACPYCNRAKGSDLGSIDPISGDLVPFFNPRKQIWFEHFALEGANLVPLTAEARVTLSILELNHPSRLSERIALIAAGQYP